MKWLFDSSGVLFENARLITPAGNERNGTLRIVGGRIDGVNVTAKRGDLRFDLAGAILLPGLINAHDHLELNTFPRRKYRPCYSNAREWALEMNARLDSDPEIATARTVPLPDRLFLGGLKNILSGATTVAHHNPVHPPLRARDFPVGVVRRYGWSHSLYLAPDFAEAYRRTARTAPYMIHLAEGTDDEAHRELEQLAAAGALGDNTVLVHGVGLTGEQRAGAVQRHAALVWCPASNFFLLDATAEVGEFSRAGRLAIGSDSRLTGERDLLDELHVAREANQIAPEAILRAVTRDGAEILRRDDIGRIRRGMRADLVILPDSFVSAADAIGTIRRGDLRAVIHDGVIRVGDPDFAPLMANPVRINLDGRDKILAGALAERLARCAVPEKGVLM